MDGYNLITLALNAPLIGVRKRWPDVLHAVDMDGLPIKNWPNGKLATSACGLTGLRLMGSGAGNVLMWPPRMASLPDGVRRCRDCYEAVPVKKVRSEFRARNADDA